MSGSGNHQYGLKGRLNDSWKSDEKITRFGYRAIRVLDHPFKTKAGFVLEHRLVAEKFLLDDKNSIVIDGKRYLKKEYAVHHKDKNRLNNSLDNLVVMLKSEHSSMHNKENPVERDKVTGRFIKKELKEITV